LCAFARDEIAKVPRDPVPVIDPRTGRPDDPPRFKAWDLGAELDALASERSPSEYDELGFLTPLDVDELQGDEDLPYDADCLQSDISWLHARKLYRWAMHAHEHIAAGEWDRARPLLLCARILEVEIEKARLQLQRDRGSFKSGRRRKARSRLARLILDILERDDMDASALLAARGREGIRIVRGPTRDQTLVYWRRRDDARPTKWGSIRKRLAGLREEARERRRQAKSD
jgi:hypothetical protein